MSDLIHDRRRSTWLQRGVRLALVVSGLFTPAPLVADDDAPMPDARDKYQVLLVDDFDGQQNLKWQILNSDPSHFSLTKNAGKLTITTQRGSMFGDKKQEKSSGGVSVKNIFLIDNPLAKDADFVVTTCVSGFTPKKTYQQAGLILYDDDDNYLKWMYEVNWPAGEGQAFVLATEAEGVTELQFFDSWPGLDRYWVRLAKHGDLYEQSISVDGREFKICGNTKWDGGPKKMGLLAKNGGRKTTEVDAGFEFFELRSSPADEAQATRSSADSQADPARDQ